MLPCEDVRQLVEEYVAETLPAARRQEVSRHLRACPGCQRMVEEARLARMVLHGAGQPKAPPGLAQVIKQAGLRRLRYRSRPLHERALGSPAFVAVCASLVCGAAICLLSILRVSGAHPTWETELPRITVVEQLEFPTRDTHRILFLPARPRLATLRRPLKVSVELAGVVPPRPATAEPAPRPPAPARLVRAHVAPSLVARTPRTLPTAHALPEPPLGLAHQRISTPGIVPVSISTGGLGQVNQPAPEEIEKLELLDLAAPQPAAGDVATSLTNYPAHR